LAAQWREVNNQQDQEEPQGGVEQSWEQSDAVQERFEESWEQGDDVEREGFEESWEQRDDVEREGFEEFWEQRDNVQERMEGVEEEAQERVVRDEGEDQVRNGMHLNNCLLKNCVINFHFSK